MPAYKVLRPISGLINGSEWPEVGGTVDIDADLAGMVGAGDLAVVKAVKVEKVEKRPAVIEVETRTK